MARVTGETGMLYVWEMNLLVWTVSVLENGCALSSSGWSVADKMCLNDDWVVWIHCGASGVSGRAKGKDDWRRVSLSSSDS